MPPRLLPTPQSSKYVEQLLAQPVDAFGKGPQNAQFAAQLANALAAGFAGYRDRKRKRAGQDALTEAIQIAGAPSGWVNPDVGMDPGYAQLPRSDVTQGTVPEGAIPDAALAAAMAGPPPRQIAFDKQYLDSVNFPTEREQQQLALHQAMQRYEAARTPEMPEGGQVVPITPFRPEAAMLEDKTQVRGRESILNALLTDERLRDLGPEDISLAQKMTLDEMIQQEPGHYLDADQKKAAGYATTDVVWQARGGAPQLLKSMAPEEPEYVEYWDNVTGDSLGLVAKGSAEEKQLVSTGGITGAKPDKPLQIVRAMQARGIVEGSDKWNTALDNWIKNAADNAPKVEVNNIEAGIDKEQEKLGELRAVRYGDIINAAAASEQLISQLELMGSIPIPEEGILTPFRDVLRKWSFAIGIPLEKETIAKIDNVANFRAVMTDLLSAKLATQTGPQTDEDARRMMASLASLTNLKEANHFIIQMGIALESRKIEQAEFWVDWEAKEETTRGAEKAWRGYKQETPLFTRHPDSGRHMFYSEWKNVMREANRGKENLEWDGNTYENTPKGFEALWQAQHRKYLSTVVGQ